MGKREGKEEWERGKGRRNRKTGREGGMGKREGKMGRDMERKSSMSA
jgi:hypothetical protein